MTPDPLQPLREAIAGLEYPSESDSPFDVVDWPSLKLPPGRSSEICPDDFFDPLKTVTDAAKFAALRRVLESLVQPLRVFRIDDGSAEVQIYLLGQTPAGRVVGVHTTSVET